FPGNALVFRLVLHGGAAEIGHARSREREGQQQRTEPAQPRTADDHVAYLRNRADHAERDREVDHGGMEIEAEQTIALARVSGPCSSIRSFGCRERSEGVSNRVQVSSISLEIARLSRGMRRAAVGENA